MVKTASTMSPLGMPAPDFALPDSQGRRVALADFRDKPALLVIFMCNHCPFVKHVAAELAKFAREYQAKGLAIVGINANDAATHPEDAPAKMAAEARLQGYTFPYLWDETQAAAKAYRASCTPDFFLFDAGRKLVYRGQFDASRPGSSIPVTGADVRRAADAVLAGRQPPEPQSPSIGCNIKWKPGHEPTYYDPAGVR